MEANKSITRQEILNAMLQSICHEGIRGTTVDALAASLGISKRTLYKRYPSKHELIRDCMERLDEEWDNALTQLKETHRGDDFACLCSFLQLYADFVSRFRSSLWNDLARIRLLSEWGQRVRKRRVGECAEVMQACQDSGYVLKRLNTVWFGTHLLEGIRQARADNLPAEQERQFLYVMLRGGLTRKGLLRLNKIMPQSSRKTEDSFFLCR